mmetsp:Transcript_130013/g.308473  ORF Transcript_130013/g.308473 Transcript_130013/m.308473 type:complete len:132 (+) Transcript_130013:719-1114(+)
MSRTSSTMSRGSPTRIMRTRVSAVIVDGPMVPSSSGRADNVRDTRCSSWQGSSVQLLAAPTVGMLRDLLRSFSCRRLAACKDEDLFALILSPSLSVSERRWYSEADEQSDSAMAARIRVRTPPEHTYTKPH